MKKRLSFLALILLTAVNLKAQQQTDIPPNSNLILVNGVTFDQICTSLLDSGYSIQKRDSELKTIRTEPKVYPKMYNAAYVINIRIKDSIAYFSGTFTAPWDDPFTRSANKTEPLWKDEKVYFHCNKKGKPYPKSIAGYPFKLINSFVRCFDKPVSYSNL